MDYETCRCPSQACIHSSSVASGLLAERKIKKEPLVVVKRAARDPSWRTPFALALASPAPGIAALQSSISRFSAAGEHMLLKDGAQSETRWLIQARYCSQGRCV